MFSTTAIAASKHCYQISSINLGMRHRPKRDISNRCEEDHISLFEPTFISLLKPEREHDQARVINEAELQIIEIGSKKKIVCGTYNGSRLQRNAHFVSKTT